MALTRAQLLAGNQSQGVVLPGQVQAVSQGLGIFIDTDGTISVDASTAEGLVRLNNPNAYNGYVWPTSLGPVGSQLTLGASGQLTWDDADGIPWTAPGQLVVGNGPNSQAILNPGATTSVLMADATATDGLQYSSSATSAILTPAGTTVQRPGLPGNVAAIAGQIRFNTDTSLLELYTGSQWVPVGSPVQAGLGINLSGTSPNEMYKLDVPVQTGPPPAGPLPAEAIDGSLYWDNTQGLLFIRYDDGSSTQWVQVIPSAPAPTTLTGIAPIDVSGSNISLNVGLGNAVSGGFLKAATDVRTGPPAAGPGQLQAIDGSLYWDNTQGLLFIRYNDGSSIQWVQVTPVTPAASGFSGSFLSQTGQTVTVVNGLIQSVV